jgi:hypothetical protein
MRDFSFIGSNTPLYIDALWLSMVGMQVSQAPKWTMDGISAEKAAN